MARGLNVIIFLFIGINSGSAITKGSTITVAQDGSGNFQSIQKAFDAVPDNGENVTVILVKPGVYKERLVLKPSKRNVKLIGEDPHRTILTYDNFANKLNPETGKNYSTTGSSSFFVEADDFAAENITFANSSGPVGQAVAVNVTANRVAFKNCRFLGFQDTLYTKGPQDDPSKESIQYYENCYIEGTVDFIFGAATAVFVECELHSKGDGYITAASTPQGKPYGYVFIECKLTAEQSGVSVALGRPWRPFAKVVYINCDMGKHIRPEGWDNWGKEENEKTVFYAEYNSKGAGAHRNKRATWARNINRKESKQYRKQQVLGNWRPFQ
ncbi:pectinesterase family protein [Olivibacter sp. CPCC 100613]|uniref:pectinesterase family protein n=1 Tax=Olivibacter sp. CPCC 100613 TaxID=3079931 RepID=UPI002FFAFFA3